VIITLRTDPAGRRKTCQRRSMENIRDRGAGSSAPARSAVPAGIRQDMQQHPWGGTVVEIHPTRAFFLFGKKKREGICGLTCRKGGRGKVLSVRTQGCRPASSPGWADFWFGAFSIIAYNTNLVKQPGTRGAENALPTCLDPKNGKGKRSSKAAFPATAATIHGTADLPDAARSSLDVFAEPNSPKTEHHAECSPSADREKKLDNRRGGRVMMDRRQRVTIFFRMLKEGRPARSSRGVSNAAEGLAADHFGPTASSFKTSAQSNAGKLVSIVLLQPRGPKAAHPSTPGPALGGIRRQTQEKKKPGRKPFKDHQGHEIGRTAAAVGRKRNFRKKKRGQAERDSRPRYTKIFPHI